MPINYQKQTYVNGSGATPLSAERLNHNENGTKAAADAIDALAQDVGTRLSVEALSATIGDRMAGKGQLATAVGLPTNLRSEWRGYNNTVAVTEGIYEYVAYVRDDMKPVIAQRNTVTGAWVVTDISGIFGLIVPDGHNYFSVAVDGSGRVHVWGNMHSAPLLYAVSDAANSVSSFTAAAMVGDEETAVTYPSPTRLPNGDLLFAYRSGISGDGKMILNRFTVATRSWKRVSVLVDGTGAGVYLSPLIADKDGVIHCAFNFRGSGNANTNRDVCYMRSRDGGATWESITGQTVPLPVTPASAPIAMPTAATGSGLLNTVSLALTADGKPHIAFLLFDANGYTNVCHLYHDGQAWRSEFVTFGTHRMELDVGIISGYVARPAIVAYADRAYVIYRTSDKPGTVRAVDVSTPGAPFEFIIANLDIRAAEPSYVNADASSSGFLKLVLSPQPPDAGEAQEINWESQWGVVLKLDLERLRLLGTQALRPPSMRVVASYALTGGTVTTSSPSDLSTAPPILIPSEYAKQITIAQLRARLNQVSGGNAVWYLAQRDSNGGSLSRRGEIGKSGTGSTMTGFVIPAVLSRAIGGGWLAVQASSTDAGGTRATVLAVEISQIENPDGTFA